MSTDIYRPEGPSANWSDEEVFRHVLQHLAQQGRQCRSRTGSGGTVCAYRFGKLRCAVGCLISPDLLKRLNGQILYTPVVHLQPCSSSLEKELSEDLGLQDEVRRLLLRELQHLHDGSPLVYGTAYSPSDWPDRARAIAQEFDLDETIVDEAFPADWKPKDFEGDAV